MERMVIFAKLRPQIRMRGCDRASWTLKFYSANDGDACPACKHYYEKVVALKPVPARRLHERAVSQLLQALVDRARLPNPCQRHLLRAH